MSRFQPQPVRIFGSPRQYIQGPGALSELGAIAERRGMQPLIVIDTEIRTMLGDAVTASFSKSPPVVAFSGEVTLQAIELLAEEGRALLSGLLPALVYGVGGGKTLDVAKGAALHLGADFVSVPTIASNDSPTGRAIAIYDEHHRLERIEHITSSPEAVVVDTAVIARAPARFLRAGMGDAIAKKFEAERANRDGALNFFGTPPLASALALADTCYGVLRRHGGAAMRAAEEHRVTADFEAVVEACLLMSGIAWESGGISLAHGVVRGIARSPGAEASLHGEHVAYGLLVMHALDERPDAEILDLIAFYSDIGQAITLKGLGLSRSDAAAITQIASWAFDAPVNGNLLMSTTEAAIRKAIARVEQFTSGD